VALCDISGGLRAGADELRPLLRELRLHVNCAYTSCDERSSAATASTDALDKPATNYRTGGGVEAGDDVAGPSPAINSQTSSFLAPSQ
jgi:hypothetical protein